MLFVERDVCHDYNYTINNKVVDADTYFYWKRRAYAEVFEKYFGDDPEFIAKCIEKAMGNKDMAGLPASKTSSLFEKEILKREIIETLKHV